MSPLLRALPLLLLAPLPACGPSSLGSEDCARYDFALAPAPASFGPELQFKQHPNVGKFAANRDRIVALKDPSRSFPIGQPLAVLKWRYSGKDETYVPLSSESIWPHPATLCFARVRACALAWIVDVFRLFS